VVSTGVVVDVPELCAFSVLLVAECVVSLSVLFDVSVVVVAGLADDSVALCVVVVVVVVAG
jgi:hypothetical protein